MRSLIAIAAASLAAFMLAGLPASAETSFRSATPTADAGTQPPGSGIWLEGRNIKTCASISIAFTSGVTEVTVQNTDRTGFSFLLTDEASDAAIYQTIQAACDHADDRSKDGWRARVYEIDLDPPPCSCPTGVQLTKLQGPVWGNSNPSSFRITRAGINYRFTL